MIEDIKGFISQLIAMFPECFSGEAPKPLKVGIKNELLAHLDVLGGSKTQLRQALAFYVGNPRYKRALVAGAARIGLDGQPDGEVTLDQQEFAQKPKKKKPKETPVIPAVAAPIDLTALIQEVIAMAIPGKIDLTIKLNALPPAKATPSGTMLFAIKVDQRVVLVELKAKAWNNMKTAAETFPRWVAAITGQMGEDVEGGFRLINPAVQVFEKKPKPAVDAPATKDKPPAEKTKPVAESIPVAITPAPVAPAPPQPIVVDAPTPAVQRVKLSLKAQKPS